VSPDTKADGLEARLDVVEDIWRPGLAWLFGGFIAVLDEVGAVKELELVEGKVYGDVVPLVMTTQPFVGKKVVVSHVLCTVTVVTSITSATFRLAKRLDLSV
jgi:hypothetical protein